MKGPIETTVTFSLDVDRVPRPEATSVWEMAQGRDLPAPLFHALRELVLAPRWQL